MRFVLSRTINALRNIGALFMNKIKNTAGIAVESILRTIIADLTHALARDFLDIDVGLGANFARYDNCARCDKSFAGTAHVFYARRVSRWRNITPLLKGRLLRENSVEHSIRYLIAHLVWMAFRHSF